MNISLSIIIIISSIFSFIPWLPWQTVLPQGLIVRPVPLDKCVKENNKRCFLNSIILGFLSKQCTLLMLNFLFLTKGIWPGSINTEHIRVINPAQKAFRKTLYAKGETEV